MVLPNDESRRSVKELLDHAKKLHMELVVWTASPAERTIVLGAIQQNEMKLQTVLFLRHEGELE